MMGSKQGGPAIQSAATFAKYAGGQSSHDYLKPGDLAGFIAMAF